MRRVRADRRVAGRVQRGRPRRARPPAGRADSGRRVRARRLAAAVVVGAGHERQRSLAGRGHERVGVEDGARLPLAPQAPQPGQRQHDRVVLARRPACAAACRRCPAAAAPQVGPDRQQLRAAPQAATCRPARPRAARRATRRRTARRADPRPAGRPRSRARQAARRARPWRCGPPGRRRRAAARPRSPSRTATCRRRRSRSAASPLVVIGTSSASPRAGRRSASATARACASASALPRVPMRSGFSASRVPPRATRIGVTLGGAAPSPAAAAAAGLVRGLECRQRSRCRARTARAAPARRRRCRWSSPLAFSRSVGWCSSRLTIVAGHQLEPLAVGVAERLPAAAVLGQHLARDRLAALVQRGDRRHDVERPEPALEALQLVLEQRLRAARLGLAPGEVALDHALEVVDVAQVHALEARATAGSMSRGTAMSISSSGRPAARCHHRLRAPRARRCGAASRSRRRTMSACSSSAGSASKRTAWPPKRWASPIARS